MKKRALTLPEVMIMAGTRVALGAGIGLLVGNRLDAKQRTAAGIALFAVGALSSIPILANFLSKESVESEELFVSMERAATILE
jgi:hypothetical protein